MLTVPELSKDSVDSLRKKVEGRIKKIETLRSGQRPGWDFEVDKLVASEYQAAFQCPFALSKCRRAPSTAVKEMRMADLALANEADNTTITNSLTRRVFIRACMWHELAVVLHSRQAAQTTLGWRAWTKDQEEAHKAVGAVWEDLGEQLKSMPIE